MRYFPLFVWCILFLSHLHAREPINVNFHNLSLENMITITSKIIKKNILVTAPLTGKINFINNKPIYKDEVLALLKTILRSKGFSIIEKNGILTIIKESQKDDLRVITIKNGQAKDIITAIKDLEAIEKNDLIHISLLQDANAIILKGDEKKVVQFTKLVKRLDIVKQQVYVQARIIELSEKKAYNIGVEYGFNGFNVSGSNLITFSSSLNGINNSSYNLLAQNKALFGDYNLENLQNSVSLGATINLLKQNEALDIVSEPSILCINNKESSIYVGETRSIPTGTTVGTTTVTNFKREDIGLKLIVKPRISDTNKVTLELRTVLEDIKETDILTGNPNTNKKEVITTVMVNNGESVILGGLIKNKVENRESKVPLLGDIPYLGTLFRDQYDINDKINLIVIVTPYIIPKTKDLTYVINQLSDLKKFEQKYTAMMVERLEKKKNNTNKKKNLEEAEQQNLEKHNQRLEEIFGL